MGVQGAGGPSGSQQMKDGSSAISGISDAGKQSELLGQANETTNEQSKSTNDANAAGQKMAQNVSGADRSSGGNEEPQSTRTATQDADKNVRS